MSEIIETSMNFVFEHEANLMDKDIISILEDHLNLPEFPGAEALNIMLVYDGKNYLHPRRAPQSRGMVKPMIIPVRGDRVEQLIQYDESLRMLENHRKRASRCLTQLVRDMVTEQDLRDSLPDFLSSPNKLNHLDRTRDVGFRVKAIDERVHRSLLQDIKMMLGYVNAKVYT